MGIKTRVIPMFRPDDVTDPEHANFKSAIDKLGADSFSSLIAKLKERRNYFKSLGATATDHGIFSPQTLKMDEIDKENEETIEKEYLEKISLERIAMFIEGLKDKDKTIFLEKYLGNYEIHKIGDKFLVRNGNKAVVIKL